MHEPPVSPNSCESTLSPPSFVALLEVGYNRASWYNCADGDVGMRCPHCGAKLGRDDWHICPACGEAIEQVRGTSKRCPSCGAKMPGRSQECPICGAKARSRRLSLPATTFSVLAGLLTAAILLGSLWILRPWTQAADPPSTKTPTATPTRILTKTLTPTPTPSITPTSTPAFFHHTIIQGDTITFIAQQYGVTVEAILAVNDVGDGEYLDVGELLTIPLAPGLAPVAPTATVGGPTPTPLPPTHVVAEGENLSLIASLYGITVASIAEANDMANPELIRVGQELLIPGAALTPTVVRVSSKPVPTPTQTPAWRYGVPVLLAPVGNAVFEGKDAPILLNWASAGILESDEWYVLRIRTEDTGPGQEASTSKSEWTKNTCWRVPDWMYPISDDEARVFKWDVTVVSRPPEGIPEAVSPRSSSRRFTWR